MMEEPAPLEAFMAEIRYRKGKEGKSAYITLPLPVRARYGLQEGQIITLRVLSVTDPKPTEKRSKK